MQKRVLHLVHTTNRRGAEVFATELHAALPGLGIDSSIIALRAGDGGLGVDAIGARGRTPSALLSLRRRLRGQDLLITYGASTLSAGAVATIGGPPMIYRSIGDPRFWGDVKARDLRIGVPMRRAARVVALWDGAAEAQQEMYRLGDNQVVVIPNGRDHRRFRPTTTDERRAARKRLGLDPDVPLAGFVGSMSWDKQPLLAVEAIARCEGVSLVMAGSGPLEAEVQAAATTCGGRVTILGAVADPRDVYRSIDALLLTSRTEGMPGVVIEAGLSGVPTVATDVGATGVLVGDTTGRLVDLGPDHHPVEALAEAITAVLSNAPVLGAAALERCQAGFTTDLVVQRWADLVTEVIAGSGLE